MTPACQCCPAYIFLFLTSRKLNSSVYGLLLVQMCLSLIGLYISFLVGSLLGNNYNLFEVARRPLCITFSALVHYFFLVYFFTTVAQSVLLYFKLVKVLGSEDVLMNYNGKVGLVCWSKCDVTYHFTE